jgi:hypothetical protein
VRVPTVITNQVLALVSNVLRHFGQEVQDAKDLEVTLRSASQIAAGSLVFTGMSWGCELLVLDEQF